MMTLEDLWYGNINPHEQFLDGNEKLKELLPIMAKDREKLSTGFSSEQNEWLEKYDDIILRLPQLPELLCGGRMGTRVLHTE